MTLDELQDKLRELRQEVGELEDSVYRERNKREGSNKGFIGAECLLGATWEVLNEAKGYVDGCIIEEHLDGQN